MFMNTLVIDKKKYVLLEQADYNNLIKQVALKKTTARRFSLSKGKKNAYDLIDKWHKEKSRF